MTYEDFILVYLPKLRNGYDKSALIRCKECLNEFKDSIDENYYKSLREEIEYYENIMYGELNWKT